MVVILIIILYVCFFVLMIIAIDAAIRSHNAMRNMVNKIEKTRKVRSMDKSIIGEYQYNGHEIYISFMPNYGYVVYMDDDLEPLDASEDEIIDIITKGEKI